ncbi:hypothetical protein BD413DRAFT_468134 [Trametes elegans]|nr:hypothetical protein BD413DRAFT_468134 [Trametes elegans]
MGYVRSRKFCCCLPVRFGVFCEGLIGLALGGLLAVGGWIAIHSMLKGTLEPPLSSSEKGALWGFAIVFTLVVLVSALGLVGSLFKILGCVRFYAGTITAVTVANVAIGIFAIYQLFHGAGASQVGRCEQDAARGGVLDGQFADFACDTGFKAGRTVVVVVCVVFWLVIIYGCYIAHEYVRQLEDEESSEHDRQWGAQKQNITVVAPYAFSAPPNAAGEKQC